MKDLYEAIERLTAQLSFRLEHIAKKRGIAANFSGFTVGTESGGLLRLFSTMLHLPRGYAVTFSPRQAPEEDGESWVIDIRRNDGLVRRTWASGLRVRKVDDTYATTYEDRVLSREDIESMLTELERPGLSGMSLDIARLWSLYHGRMGWELATHLDKLSDVDHMDRIYDALINESSRESVEDMIRNPPAIPGQPYYRKPKPKA